MTSSLGLTHASLLTLSPQTWFEASELAVSCGYDSVWTAETTGAEAFATLSSLGRFGLGLGTGVLALQLRTPMLAVMGAATLQALYPDQEVILGVGISSPTVVGRWHGAEYSARPLAQVREYLQLVRLILNEPVVNFSGEFYHCQSFRLGVRLQRQPKVVLGALNPRMLQLGGEIADGVLLNYLPSSHVERCITHIHAGEQVAGRAPGSCEVFAYVHAGVGDLDYARPYAQRDLFSYAVVDSYARAFTAAGFGEEVTQIRNAHQAKDRDAALASVSDEMINQIDHIGDAPSVAEFMNRYRSAGVHRPVLMPLPWAQDRSTALRATIEAAAIPHESR